METMITIGDVLFEIFWIITGLTANVLALSLGFAVFAMIWKVFIINKKGGEE